MNVLDRDRLAALLARAGTTRIVAGGLALALAVIAVVGLATVGGGGEAGDNASRSTGAEPRADAPTDPTVTDGTVALDVTTESPVTDATDGPAAVSSEAPAPGGSAAPAPSRTAAAGATPPAATAAPATTAPRPLSITEFGWAQASTSQNGWVPPEGLPVAMAGGDVDRMSFFRLGGSGTVLKLGVLSRESGPLNEGPAVVACPITADAWKAAPRQQLTRAPAYDAANCVNGKRFDSTTITFDLTRFPERTGGRGFAVVPKGPVGGTFEIVLSSAARA